MRQKIILPALNAFKYFSWSHHKLGIMKLVADIPQLSYLHVSDTLSTDVAGVEVGVHDTAFQVFSIF